MTPDFQECYTALYPGIYRFVFGMTGNGPEAEDLAQETFLKLYETMRKNGGLVNPKAWAYRVAANLTINLLKRHANLRRLLQFQVVPEADYRDAESQCLKDLERRRVRQALDSMPLRDKTILMLYQENLSYGDISGAMGINASSVGKILSRAREKLMTLLNEGGNHEVPRN